MNGIWNSIKRNFESRYFWLANVTPDWDFVKAFFRSPLFNIVALLPILGFIIVQIGTLTQQISAGQEYSEHFKIFTDRIVGIYWGSYYYLSAYVVYLLGSAPAVRSSAHTDEFLEFVQQKNSPRLTISFIFQSVRSAEIFGSESRETTEFVDCVRIWILRVLSLPEDTIERPKEVEYILGRISGSLEVDPAIQDDLVKFRDLLLDLSVRYHKHDPWIQELNDNIAHIFYRENARRANTSRLLCLLFIALGTIQIFGIVVWNHIQIASAF